MKFTSSSEFKWLFQGFGIFRVWLVEGFSSDSNSEDTTIREWDRHGADFVSV